MGGVSFIVTVYNKREFLPRVLAALAAQSGDFGREYVFVDDGSTDGSLAYLRAATAGWPQCRIIEGRDLSVDADNCAGRDALAADGAPRCRRGARLWRERHL